MKIVTKDCHFDIGNVVFLRRVTVYDSNPPNKKRFDVHFVGGNWAYFEEESKEYELLDKWLMDENDTHNSPN